MQPNPSRKSTLIKIEALQMWNRTFLTTAHAHSCLVQILQEFLWANLLDLKKTGKAGFEPLTLSITRIMLLITQRSRPLGHDGLVSCIKLFQSNDASALFLKMLQQLLENLSLKNCIYSNSLFFSLFLCAHSFSWPSKPGFTRCPQFLKRPGRLWAGVFGPGVLHHPILDKCLGLKFVGGCSDVEWLPRG